MASSSSSRGAGRPGIPRRLPIADWSGHVLLGSAAPATTRLPKDLGVVNLGNDVGGGEPKVASERVTLCRGHKRRQPGAQLAKVLAGPELCRGERRPMVSAKAHSPPHVGWEIMEAEDHLAPRHPFHVHGAKRRMLEGMEAAFEIIEVEPHVRDRTTSRGEVPLQIFRLGATLGSLALC